VLLPFSTKYIIARTRDTYTEPGIAKFRIVTISLLQYKPSTNPSAWGFPTDPTYIGSYVGKIPKIGYGEQSNLTPFFSFETIAVTLCRIALVCGNHISSQLLCCYTLITKDGNDDSFDCKFVRSTLGCFSMSISDIWLPIRNPRR
jgi:hypothetical protein